MKFGIYFTAHFLNHFFALNPARMCNTVEKITNVWNCMPLHWEQFCRAQQSLQNISRFLVRTGTSTVTIASK